MAIRHLETADAATDIFSESRKLAMLVTRIGNLVNSGSGLDAKAKETCKMLTHHAQWSLEQMQEHLKLL
jgi:hypothetical protein